MIGDVLTSSILFEGLRQKYPSAELHYLVHEHTKPVLLHNPFIDKTILFSPEENKKAANFLMFLQKIKKEEYDVVIDVYAKLNSAIITLASGAKKRISYAKWYTKFAYTETFFQKKKTETNAGFAIENRMLLLKALNNDFPLEIKPKIYLTDQEKKHAEEILSSAGIELQKPLIMVSVLGSSDSKTYPLPYLAKLLDIAVKEKNAQLIFNYIPKQEKQARELYHLCSPKTQNMIFLNVFGKSLREFMALTSYCDALIGNEGGAVNMAKALNIPTFAIFSPWIRKEAWALYEGKKNVAVHLKDYNPEAYNGIDAKKENLRLYNLFKPELLRDSYLGFLGQL